MDYFSFYDIPISLELDLNQLKKIFQDYSKKYHPDFYTLEDQATQDKALENSTLNNNAYKVLKDFDLRLKYILDTKNVLEEEGQNKLPQDFLMEMMDINESIMELQMDFDQAHWTKVEKELSSFENELLHSITIDIKEYHGQENYDYDRLKNYYFKKKYLRRLKDHLSGIQAEI